MSAPIDVRLDAIEEDASIQCRAAIDTGVVNEYAEAMTEGATFPPVVLFVADGKHYIGDGWHRIMASKQIKALSISATVEPGGRPAALKHALSANAIHGHRRTNADKRRCVEIALREFTRLSSRAIAEMCGVGDAFVGRVKAEVHPECTSPVTGADGKQYPARRDPEVTRTRLAEELAKNAVVASEAVQAELLGRWRALQWRLESAVEAVKTIRRSRTPAPCVEVAKGIRDSFKAIGCFLFERLDERDDGRPWAWMVFSFDPDMLDQSTTTLCNGLLDGKDSTLEPLARALLRVCPPNQLLKFYSELGYGMRSAGIISRWPQAIREMLDKIDAGAAAPQTIVKVAELIRIASARDEAAVGELLELARAGRA